MAEKPKIGQILLIVFLVLSVGAGIFLYLGLSSEQNQRKFYERQYNKVKAEQMALQREIDELKSAKSALEGDLETSKAEAQKAADELAQEKRARETLTARISQMTQEAKTFQIQLESERQEKLTLTDELAKAKQSYRSLSNELTTLRQAKEALERRVKEMLKNRSDAIEPIVVTPPVVSGSGNTQSASSGYSSSPASSAAGKSGKVLVVNREFNFVVINLGSNDGLAPGMTITLAKENGEPLGQAEVERVYDNMAAATLVAESQMGKVREGDGVRVQY
ncbi:MAG: hypothetical protein COV76_06120 [Candidatus Omnitrophica bacterium CG11_big_fil_rev_8_21_14_0_20_64_10]|nr:MAG: hypothetical protein COV76_06120 [Candidatus Omnitrophica bacterium CG11_big_fil_rev_8_21_14_0_20_64_10]